MTSPVAIALGRLREAADASRVWPETTWRGVHGPVADEVTLRRGGFEGLVLQPGTQVVLASNFNLPAKIAGEPIDGEPLELTITSLFPIQVRWNERTVFEEYDVPPAAPGPALVQVAPAIHAGDNGEMTIHITVPDNQVLTWLNFSFTTPRLRRRFEALDIAWSQLFLADAIAVDGGDREAATRAAEAVPDNVGDLPADAVDKVGAAVQAALSGMADRVASIGIHVIGHSHIDMNWLWTWDDTREVIKRDFGSVLAILDDYPEMTFTHSQPATYELIQSERPDLFAKVVEHISSGRWETATMQWVEGDTNMASGESTIRQLLEARVFTRDQLGTRSSTFLAPDTFGHAGNLPQLAVSAGAERYYHHRCNPGQADLWPAYWWEGQDGTRILAISTPSYNGEITAGDVARSALHAWRHGLPAGLLFHGIGDHGGGPSRHNLDTLRHLQEVPGLPAARCSTLERYTDEVLSSGATLPTHRGESSTIFEGCYTTHADSKRYNRAGENLLTTAETLAAVAGLPAETEVADAWRKVLFNQFHDILDGSAIHEAYVKNRVDFEEAAAVAKGVVKRALDVLTAGHDAGTVTVTNPLGFDRRDVVVAAGLEGTSAVWLVSENGHRTPGQYTANGLCFAAEVPALSTAGYRVEVAEPAAVPNVAAVPAHAPTGSGHVDLFEPGAVDTGAPYLRVETTAFTAYVRRDSGIIVHLLDKRANRQLVKYGMRRGSDYLDTARADLGLNVLQLLEEDFHGMSAWHLDEVSRETSLLSGATTEVVESGPVRLVLRVTRSLGKTSIAQLITFYRDLGRIDFQADLDWQHAPDPTAGLPNLKVAFTASMLECQAWFETPYAAAQREPDGQEVPALRWADMGGEQYGIALLNDSKYGYDVLGNRIRLTLVRSGADPDPISDLGEHSIRYALMPHPGSWRDAGVVQEAAGFNQPLIARLASKPGAGGDPWRPRASSGSVLLSCLKPAHDGAGRVLRLYESAGRAGEVELSGFREGQRVFDASVVEERIRELPAPGGVLRLSCRPWQVRTLLVEG